jgi:hypothetical protein
MPGGKRGERAGRWSCAAERAAQCVAPPPGPPPNHPTPSPPPNPHLAELGAVDLLDGGADGVLGVADDLLEAEAHAGGGVGGGKSSGKAGGRGGEMDARGGRGMVCGRRGGAARAHLSGLRGHGGGGGGGVAAAGGGRGAAWARNRATARRGGRVATRETPRAPGPRCASRIGRVDVRARQGDRHLVHVGLLADGGLRGGVGAGAGPRSGECRRLPARGFPGPPRAVWGLGGAPKQSAPSAWWQRASGRRAWGWCRWRARPRGRWSGRRAPCDVWRDGNGLGRQWGVRGRGCGVAEGGDDRCATGSGARGRGVWGEEWFREAGATLYRAPAGGRARRARRRARIRRSRARERALSRVAGARLAISPRRRRPPRRRPPAAARRLQPPWQPRPSRSCAPRVPGPAGGSRPGRPCMSSRCPQAQVPWVYYGGGGFWGSRWARGPRKCSSMRLKMPAPACRRHALGARAGGRARVVG